MCGVAYSFFRPPKKSQSTAKTTDSVLEKACDAREEQVGEVAEQQKQGFLSNKEHLETSIRGQHTRYTEQK